MVHRAAPFGSFPPKSGLVLAMALGSAFFGFYYGYERNRVNNNTWKSFEKRLIKEERIKRKMAINKVDELEKTIQKMQFDFDVATGKRAAPEPETKIKKAPVDFIDSWVNIDMSDDDDDDDKPPKH